MSWRLELRCTAASIHDDTHPWRTNGVTMGGTSLDHRPMGRKLRPEVRPLPLLRQLLGRGKTQTLAVLPFFNDPSHWRKWKIEKQLTRKKKKKKIHKISIFQLYIFHSLKGTLNWQASLGPRAITLLSFKSVFHQPKQPHIFATKTPLSLIPSTVTLCHDLVSLGCSESLALL